MCNDPNPNQTRQTVSRKVSTHQPDSSYLMANCMLPQCLRGAVLCLRNESLSPNFPASVQCRRRRVPTTKLEETAGTFTLIDSQPATALMFITTDFGESKVAAPMTLTRLLLRRRPRQRSRSEKIIYVSSSSSRGHCLTQLQQQLQKKIATHSLLNLNFGLVWVALVGFIITRSNPPWLARFNHNQPVVRGLVRCVALVVCCRGILVG